VAIAADERKMIGFGLGTHGFAFSKRMAVARLLGAVKLGS